MKELYSTQIEKFSHFINPFGEKVVLVGASKTQTAETINNAICSGLENVGENKPQEFRDKQPLLLPVNYHFFGRLQKNKVKYLIGKCCLIQSVDSIDLAEEISLQSVKKQVETNVLIEVNLGEEQKGGLPIDNVFQAYRQIKKLQNVKILGLMCVLPNDDNIENIKKLCLLMREKYDILKKDDNSISILSMGMSKDYLTAIECGSNMIRIGTGIFGARNYKETK